MNRDLIDLHVHTTASDGTMTPEEVVRHAAKCGLRAIAITDHDTVDGVPEALAAGTQAGVEVVPGVEIGVDFQSEMHILGYFIELQNPVLQQKLGLLREYRDQRNPRMVEKLVNLGFDISMTEITREANGKVVGRPHFAAVMKRKGYVRDFGEAFDKYLAAGKPAYVKKDRLTPQEGIELILGAGGLPVLAHPKYLEGNPDVDLGQLVRQLAGYGLRGIEVYYTTHSAQEIKRYKELAAEAGLLVTGGTDFHGANKPAIRLGRGEDNLAIGYEVLENLKKLRS